jgi:hypothetical protein
MPLKPAMAARKSAAAGAKIRRAACPLMRKAAKAGRYPHPKGNVDQAKKRGGLEQAQGGEAFLERGYFEGHLFIIELRMQCQWFF